jgi:hypothetical protein
MESNDGSQPTKIRTETIANAHAAGIPISGQCHSPRLTEKIPAGRRAARLENDVVAKDFARQHRPISRCLVGMPLLHLCLAGRRFVRGDATALTGRPGGQNSDNPRGAGHPDRG